MKCHNCDGSGWITTHKLVTYYHQSSFKINRAETIIFPEYDRMKLETEPQNYLRDFRGKLDPKTQDILSAVSPCVCLGADHKAMTGER